MPKIGMMALRKDALVNATISEIGRQGSLDVTVSQIARSAGVSSALAHHYFGSKDDLFLAAMRSILSEFGKGARERLAKSETPAARLRAIVEANFAGTNFRPDVVSAWMNFYVMAQKSPAAQRLLRIYQRRIVSNLTHALRPLCDTPEGVALTAAALIDGLYIRHAVAEAGPPDPQAAIARVMTYLDGVTQ